MHVRPLSPPSPAFSTPPHTGPASLFSRPDDSLLLTRSLYHLTRCQVVAVEAALKLQGRPADLARVLRGAPQLFTLSCATLASKASCDALAGKQNIRQRHKA